MLNSLYHLIFLSTWFPNSHISHNSLQFRGLLKHLNLIYTWYSEARLECKPEQYWMPLKRVCDRNVMIILLCSLTGNLARLAMALWDFTPRSVLVVNVVASSLSPVMMPRSQFTLQLSWATRLAWPTLSEKLTNLAQVSVISCLISRFFN